MNLERMRQYASLKKQISALEAEVDMIKDTVLEDVKQYIAENDGATPEVTGVGKFSLEHRKSWTYSPEYEDLKVELAKKKKEEEQTGLATYEESETLKFIVAKDE